MIDESEADLDALWQQALDASSAPEKKSRFHRPQPSPPQIRLQSSDDLAAYIESRGTEFKDFRGKHGRLWSTLEKFVTPVSAMISLANTAATFTPVSAASTAVLNAVAFLVQACEGVSSAYDWIEQVFRGEMLDFTNRLVQYLDVKLDQIMQGKIVSILAVIFKLIKRSDHLIRKGRFRQYLNVAFVGKDSETKALVDDLDRELGSEQRYVVAATFASAKKTQERTKEIDASLRRVGSDINKVLSETTQGRDEAVFKSALCPTSAADDVEAIYFRTSKALAKGSGGWLQQEPAYQSWSERRTNLLWILGGPGSGKTHLSTWLIQQLTEKSRSTAEIAVGYFFVKEDSDNLRDANTILKTVAWQIAQQDPDYKKYAITVCEKKITTITYQETWQNLFLSYFSARSSTTTPLMIVIDGLDEATADTRRGLLRLLHPFARLGDTSNIHVAVIGRLSIRGDTDRDMFRSSCIVEVSQVKTKRDIDQYVKERLVDVRLLRTMRKLQPDGLKKANKLGSRILRRVSDGADGVFLWAKLLLDSIMHRDQKQIEALLVSPPASLDDMIWSVFNRIDEDDDLDHDVIRKVIHLVTYARNPLTFKDIYTNVVLPDLTPNYLLWGQVKGAMSSILDIKPPDWDRGPHEETTTEIHSGRTDSECSDGEEFSFSDHGSDIDSVTDNKNDDDDDDGLGDPTETDTGRPDASEANDLDNSSIETVSSLQSDSGSDDEASGTVKEEFMSCVGYSERDTTITFCHAWIRDFVIREGNPTMRRKPALSVMPSAEDTHTEMALACLGAYQVLTKLNEPYWRELTRYAVTNMGHHLNAINPITAPQSKVLEMAQSLHLLFGTNAGARFFINSAKSCETGRQDIWGSWVATTSCLTAVQGLLHEADAALCSSTIGEKAAQWIHDASVSLAVLLEKPMKVASRLWLVRSSANSPNYTARSEFPAWLLHGWLSMIEGNTDDRVIREWEWWERSSEFDLLTEERIEHLTAWADLERTEHWHTCLGWVLEDGRYHDAAKTHFDQALEINPANWMAMRGIAHGLAARDDFGAAVELLHRAIEHVPAKRLRFQSLLWNLIARYSAKSGDRELCASSALKALGLKKHDAFALNPFADTLNEIKDYQTLIKGFELSVSTSDQSGATMLSTFFHYFGWADVRVIGPACRAQGRPKFILDVMEEVQNDISRQNLPARRILPEFGMAQLKHHYYGLEDAALPLYEAFLDDLPRLLNDRLEWYDDSRFIAASTLAQLYFDILVRFENQMPEERSAVEAKFKALAASVPLSSLQDFEKGIFFTSQYPAMLWGRWLREHSHNPGSVWKEWFRARILKQLNALTGQATNYIRALNLLSRSLFHAGDRGNAGAILAMLFSDYEVSTIPAEEQDERAQSLSQPRPKTAEVQWDDDDIDLKDFICKGCNVTPSDAQEFFICEVCRNETWCGNCLAILRDADKSRRFELLVHACNPVHDFYRAWPIPEAAMLAATQVFGVDRTVRNEWVEHLRKEWMAK